MKPRRIALWLLACVHRRACEWKSREHGAAGSDCRRDLRDAAAAALSGQRLPGRDRHRAGDRQLNRRTGRKFFLDYPCDLKRGEKVTFVLSLHGGGSYGNWQRHYFPIVDYKDKYRLVIATPNCAAARLDGNRRRVPAEHRHARVRRARKEEHQSVLARRPLAGRYDLEQDCPNRFLQGQGRRLAQSVGRASWRQSRPRELRPAAPRRSSGGRSRGGARRRSCQRACGRARRTGRSAAGSSGTSGH